MKSKVAVGSSATNNFLAPQVASIHEAMACLSKMLGCAGSCPLLVPYPAESNFDPFFFGDAPTHELEQAVRSRPYHPIMVPTLCVLCIRDKITPWCRPPLIAVIRCHRCNKPCCFWHAAAHDFMNLPPVCYGNPTDQQWYCSRANDSLPNGCFEIIFRQNGTNRFAPAFPGPYGHMHIPRCVPQLKWHPAYEDNHKRDISEETRPRINAHYLVIPEVRRRGPPPFVSRPVHRHYNDPEWRAVIADLWQDMPPSYVNGFPVINLDDWHGRVFSDGHHPMW